MEMEISPLRLVIVVAFCLSLAGLAAAQDKKMYQWTDENGVVHFSDTRPEGLDAKTLDMPADKPASGSNPYQQTDSVPSLADQKRQELARKYDQAQTDIALNEANCAALQAELARLEPNRRVFYTDEEGETVRMDDVERANRVAELKSQIARDCK